MNDLISILEQSEDSLNNMLKAFYYMAQYEGRKVYIDIVKSTDYEETSSVQSLFKLLAPFLTSPDYSVLKALVKAAKCEEAMERLTTYLEISTNVQLSTVSRRPSLEHIPENQAAGSVATSPLVISSEPTANHDCVPVSATVAVDEMSWGMLRGIHSLVCGVFRVPPFCLQYDCAEPGSVTIKWTTSKKIAFQILSIVLDDIDLNILLGKGIVRIQVGKIYTISTGNSKYWMVSNLLKLCTRTHYC